MKNCFKRPLSLLLAGVTVFLSLPIFSLATVAETEEVESSESYDYSSLYTTEGLVFQWSGFDLKEGDPTVTVLENEVGDQNVTLTAGTPYDGYFYTKDILDFTSFLSYELKGEGGDIMVFDDFTFEVHLRQIDGVLPAPTSPENASFSMSSGQFKVPTVNGISMRADNLNEVSGVSNWKNKYPVNESYGFISETYATLAPLSGTTSVEIATDLNRNPIKWLGNTQNKPYALGVRFDYAVADENATTGTLTVDYLRDFQTVASMTGDYDGRYYGNWKSTTAEPKRANPSNQKLTFGGLGYGYSMIRIYNRALTDEELTANHVADLFSYYHVDPALYTELSELDRSQANAMLCNEYIGASSKEKIESIIETVTIPTSDELYLPLYVQDGLIYLWDGYDLSFDGTSVTELVSKLDSETAIDRITKDRLHTGITETGTGIPLARMYQHEKSVLFGTAANGDATTSVNSHLLLTPLLPFRESEDGVTLPSDMTLEMMIAYPSQYKTNPSQTVNTVSVAGWDGARLFFGPLGTEGIGISYSKVNNNQYKGNGPIIDAPNAPFNSWSGRLSGLDNGGQTAFLGSALDQVFHTAITFDYDEEETDYTAIPYVFSAFRDGNIAMSNEYLFDERKDYSTADGESTKLQLTFGLDIATQYYTIRMYNRALSESELEQNHTVDLFKYYGVDISLYNTLDEATRVRLYSALADYRVGETSKEEIEALIDNFALTGGLLGVMDIDDYMSFLGIQARTDDYAAIRMRYFLKSESLQKLENVGASYSFGAMYAKKDAVSSKDDLKVVFNREISEFVKEEGNFTCIAACHNGELKENLDYLTKDSTGIDFGIMLPPIQKEQLASGEASEEYYVRGYIGIDMNGSSFVLYLDTDDGAFGESISIAEASEYFVCNGYATAEIPSLLADPAVLAGAQAAEALYHEISNDNKNIQNDILMVNGAYEGASASSKNFLTVDEAMASVNMSVVPLPVSYTQAVAYAQTAATARGELTLYFDIGLKAYDRAKESASALSFKTEERYAVAYDTLRSYGLDDEAAAEKARMITHTLQSEIITTQESVTALDTAYGMLTELQTKLSSSQAELKLQKIINASSSLFIEGTTVARYTIVTNSENLAVAKLLQQFFVARQGAFVGIYRTDNEYVNGMHDFSGTKAIYVGLTDKYLSDVDTFSVYYDQELSSLCIEGKNINALLAGASEFLHRFCIGSGRIRVSKENIGTTLVNKSYLFMYEMNTQTEFPKINVSSLDATGVMEGFIQRLSEMPDHVTVVPKFTTDDFSSSAALTFYVAEDGDDTAKGTIDAPFATLDRALEASAYCGGAVILIRGGTYSLDTTVKIMAEHSGTLSSPLMISAYEDEEVYFTTGKTFSGAFLTKATEADFLPSNALKRLNTFKANNEENVYALDLTALGLSKEDLQNYASGKTSPCLYIGDQNYRVARYPNIDAPDDPDLRIEDGFIRTMNSKDDVKEIGQVSGGISELYPANKDNPHKYFEFYIDKTTYADHLLAYDQTAVKNMELWMHGSVYAEWNNISANLSILKDSAGRPYVQSTEPATYGIRYSSANHVYFYNMLEDLDCHEEYVVDTEHMILYVYSEESLADKSLTLCYRNHAAVSISSAQNVVIDNLHFERIFGYGVEMSNADHVLVQDCVFRNLSGDAVNIASCTQSGVTYSEFYACNGINTTAGNLSSLTPTRNFIQNNRFMNAGDNHAMTRAVMFSGVADVVSHNYFYETRLYVGQTYESIIEYNEFERGSQFTRDNGPIYTNDNTRALHIRYNYLHDLNYSDFGIYLDDLSSGDYVYGNIVHFAEGSEKSRAIFLHNGSMNVVINNICIGATTAGIQNSANYFVQTINGVPTGVGGSSYRWADVVKNRLSKNGNYLTQFTRESRFPLYAAYTIVVDRAISQMERNPNWDHANKISPEEDDEIYVRTPLYNIYQNNVFFDCKVGLDIPAVGRDGTVATNNVSFEATDTGIFTDYENGDFSIPEGSVIFDSIPFFVVPDMSQMGVLAD